MKLADQGQHCFFYSSALGNGGFIKPGQLEVFVPEDLDDLMDDDDEI